MVFIERLGKTGTGIGWLPRLGPKQGSVVVGEYYAANCSAAADTDCACNLGARTLALISPNQTLAAPFAYEATTCSQEGVCEPGLVSSRLQRNSLPVQKPEKLSKS